MWRLSSANFSFPKVKVNQVQTSNTSDILLMPEFCTWPKQVDAACMYTSKRLLSLQSTLSRECYVLCRWKVQSGQWRFPSGRDVPPSSANKRSRSCFSCCTVTPEFLRVLFFQGGFSNWLASLKWDCGGSFLSTLCIKPLWHANANQILPWGHGVINFVLSLESKCSLLFAKRHMTMKC